MKKEPQNVVGKILSTHLVEGDPSRDAEIGIRIDQTLTQDATGTMAYLQFESMDVPRVSQRHSPSPPALFCDPMDCIPPGSSVHRILQARILECVAMPSSRGSSQPRYRCLVS